MINQRTFLQKYSVMIPIPGEYYSFEIIKVFIIEININKWERTWLFYAWFEYLFTINKRDIYATCVTRGKINGVVWITDWFKCWSCASAIFVTICIQSLYTAVIRHTKIKCYILYTDMLFLFYDFDI